MKHVTFKITGTLPLLVHNARLASPLDKYSRMIKEISGPVFNEWACVFTLMYMPDQVNRETIIEVVNNAGQLIGIGDWRPRFGLFDSEIVNES